MRNRWILMCIIFVATTVFVFGFPQRAPAPIVPVPEAICVEPGSHGYLRSYCDTAATLFGGNKGVVRPVTRRDMPEDLTIALYGCSESEMAWLCAVVPGNHPIIEGDCASGDWYDGNCIVP